MQFGGVNPIGSGARRRLRSHRGTGGHCVIVDRGGRRVDSASWGLNSEAFTGWLTRGERTCPGRAHVQMKPSWHAVTRQSSRKCSTVRRSCEIFLQTSGSMMATSSMRGHCGDAKTRSAESSSDLDSVPDAPPPAIWPLLRLQLEWEKALALY